MRQRKQRHLWRGIFGGILLGLSLALFSFVYGFNALGQYTMWIMALIGLVLGILLVFVPRPWGRGRPPEATGG